MQAPASHTCPRCHAQSARPNRIAHEDSTEARIVLKCDACRHRWSAMVPIDESWPEVRHQMQRESSFRDQS